MNDNNLSWLAINNKGYAIDVSLEIVNPEYNSIILNRYLKNC